MVSLANRKGKAVSPAREVSALELCLEAAEATWAAECQS